MKSYRTPTLSSAPGRPSPISLLPLVLGGLLWSARPIAAQALPPPSQVQAALQDPAIAEQVRARLRQSGLTPEQVRARLRASGYSETLLDPYLSAVQGGQAQAPGAAVLSAVTALGLPPVLVPEPLFADTGLILSRAGAGGLPPEQLAAGNYVFGVDVFRRRTTQFLPLLAGPVPPDYRLGPGDIMALILTGDVELAYTLQVTREGFILIPQVGQVHVANLTLDRLRDVLYSRLGRVYSGVRRTANATTRFDVTVTNVRANQVYVVGEVAQPGAYQISSLATVLTALYAAGGVTERANMRAIEVRRAGTAVATLDLYDYLLRGDVRSDVRLETGDVVFVPVHGVRAQVTGAVVRPAVYELLPGENLSDLFRAAGGFRPDAELRRVSVHRLLPVAARSPGRPTRAVVDVELAVARPGSREQGAVRSADGVGGVGGVAIPSVALENGDSVVVDTVPRFPEAYYVGIAGMVNKPGMYPWREGMTLRDLVLLARGPRVGASLKEAEIARMPEDRSRGQLANTVRVPLDSTYLFERDSTGRYVGPPGLPFPASGAPEVPLAPYDNVLILRQPDFDFQRTVVVAGEVRYPGTYALRSKEDRLAGVIGRAGGLTDQAYAEGIRFVRGNGTGRINIDLPRALRDVSSRDNVILQPDDSVFIPEYQPSVKVGGAVNSPGSVLWQRGQGLGYYLSAAGGFARNADKGAVSVRYANGEVRTRRRGLFQASDPRPGPGSEVFVPAKDPSERTDMVALVGAIAQILASTVAIIVVATR